MVHRWVVSRVWRIFEYSNIRIIFNTNIHSYHIRIVSFYTNIFGYSFVLFSWYKYIRIFICIEINTNVTLWCEQPLICVGHTARRAQRTKSRGPMGPQKEVGSRRAHRLLVFSILNLTLKGKRPSSEVFLLVVSKRFATPFSSNKPRLPNPSTELWIIDSRRT